MIHLLRFFLIIFYCFMRILQFFRRTKKKVRKFFAPKRKEKEYVTVEQDTNWAGRGKAMKKMFDAGEGTYVDYIEEKD